MSADRWTLRHADPSEAGLLTALALRSKAHWGYPDEFMAACRKELTYDGRYLSSHEVFVIETGGSVEGFCTLESLDGGDVELGGLFVEPRSIGKGLGRALLRHAIAAARGAGVRRMVVHTDPHAKDFYLACGAVEKGSVPSASIPGRDLPLLEIDLAESQ